MQASFKLGAKNVKESSNNVEKVLCDLKRGRLSEDLFDSVQFEKAAWLVEKLSIVNDKPIMMDYWLDSFGGDNANVLIGVRETQEKLLVRSEEEYTSSISKIFS